MRAMFALAFASVDWERVEEEHRSDGLPPSGEEIVGGSPGSQIFRQSLGKGPKDEWGV